MILMVLPPNSAVSAWADIGADAANASNDRYSRRSRRREAGTAGYCGGGACSRHIWLSPRMGDHQSPHLSQPAKVAPSRIIQRIRRPRMPGVIEQRSAFATVGMATRCRRLDLEHRSRPSYSRFPNGFPADVRPPSLAAPSDRDEIPVSRSPRSSLRSPNRPIPLPDPRRRPGAAH